MKQNVLPSIIPQKVVGVAQVVSLAAAPHLNADLICRLVESHLQTQRSAVKMLHERILVLLKYVTDVIAGLYISLLNV